MRYIKGILLSILAFFIATAIYLVIAIPVSMRKFAPPSGGEVAADLRALLISPLDWMIAIAAFALGFYIELRREPNDH
jgi:hypothetical protein